MSASLSTAVHRPLDFRRVKIPITQQQRSSCHRWMLLGTETKWAARYAATWKGAESPCATRCCRHPAPWAIRHSTSQSSAACPFPQGSVRGYGMQRQVAYVPHLPPSARSRIPRCENRRSTSDVACIEGTFNDIDVIDQFICLLCTRTTLRVVARPTHRQIGDLSVYGVR